MRPRRTIQVQEIAPALDYFKVPEREEQEVLAAIVAGEDEVINPMRG